MTKRIRFRTELWDHGTIFAMAAYKGARGPDQLRAVVNFLFGRYSGCRPSRKLHITMRKKLTQFLRDASAPTSAARKLQRKRRRV